MTDNYLELEIITPEGIFYIGRAGKVELNTTEGQIGVYPGHVPVTMIAAPGILKITESESVKAAELQGGFLKILPDKMTILAEDINLVK